VIIDDGCHYLFPRAAKLSILGQKVALIYGHQIIEPENATTDATKAYLGFQSAYVGYPAKIDSFDLSKAIAAIMSSSQENRVDMEAAQACLDEGNGLEALKKIREIIRRDEASPRLSNVASEVLVPAQTIASVEFIPSAHSTPLPEAGKAMRLPERPTRLSKDSLVANAIRRAPEIYRQG
jgi:flagellar biosynthesis regulator FlbT